MSRSHLEGKTIRPGSLGGYNYYHSRRTVNTKSKAKSKSSSGYKFNPSVLRWIIILLLVGTAGFWLFGKGNDKQSAPEAPAAIATVETSDKKANAEVAKPAEAKKVNRCEGNTVEKLIKISVEARHLWTCEGTKVVRSTPVITGLRGHAETETPVGTYKIYAKAANTTLKGQDSRGAWNYPVHYWMPFLDNQHGTYGFHDATWRPANEFGNISPDSDKASHGCVELPLAVQKWLYDWAPVGTTVTVES